LRAGKPDTVAAFSSRSLPRASALLAFRERDEKCWDEIQDAVCEAVK
jgi:hypothetical protein